MQEQFLPLVGINSVMGSLGFLTRNLADRADPNVYIVFPQHCLPSTYVSIPFLFQNVLVDSDPVPKTRLVYFLVIGYDAVSDVAVGVLDRRNRENAGVSFQITKEIKIWKQLPQDLYNVTDTFYMCNNDTDLMNKQLAATTVENFYFHGPNDMIQFLFPDSILLQQSAITGISGSPVVDLENRCIGMVVRRLNGNANAEPIATSCSVLSTVVFDILIPRFLMQEKVALSCQNGPNIFNSVDFAGELAAQGTPKAFLGFFGQYVNQQSVEQCSQLQQLPDLNGFVITGFYRSYNVASNTLSAGNFVKKSHDNTDVRLFTPFNPSSKPPTFLYQWINTSSTRCIVLYSIQFVDVRSGSKRVVLLGHGTRTGSISDFMYHADPSRSFTVFYAYYSDSQWVTKSETICPVEETYVVNSTTYVTRTTDFPPFILGDEVASNLYNMTQSGAPYEFTMLRFSRYK